MNTKNTQKKIYSVIFLVFIFSIFFSAAGYEVKDYLDKREDAALTSASYSAKAEYPLEEDAPPVSDNSENTGIENKIFSIEQKFENSFTSDYFARMPFIFGNKGFERLMGFNATTSKSGTANDPTNAGDIILTLDDGRLSYISDNVTISDKAEIIADFGKKMETQKRHFLYFETPVKADTIDSTYRGVYRDYSESITAQAMETMQQNGLAAYSMSDYIKTNHIDKSSLFFYTDHHWLPQSGILASRLFCEQLNQRFGHHIDLSVYDDKNYRIEYTQPIFIGSQGRNVTEVYCEKEAVPIVTPLYDTDDEVFLSAINKTLTGTVEETLINKERLEKAKENVYTVFPYSMYGYGDHALVRIRNRKLHDGKRILIIKSSFVNAMMPFLPNAAEYVDFIDLRYFDGSLMKYIEKTNPDTVAVIYGANMFQGYTEDMTSLSFDFR